VLDHYGGDLERVNIHPRARKRVLARYGSPLTAGAGGGVASGGVASGGVASGSVAGGGVESTQ
jgi:alkane 1-monooxygenase